MNIFRIKELKLDITPNDVDGETTLIVTNNDDGFSMSIGRQSYLDEYTQDTVSQEAAVKIAEVLMIDDDIFPYLDILGMRVISEKFIIKKDRIREIIENN